MSERSRKRALLGMVPCDVCVCASVRRVIHARRCVRGGHVVSARQSLLSAGSLFYCNVIRMIYIRMRAALVARSGARPSVPILRA